MTRNGKIVRLPLAIRQRLNQRPQNGALAQDLLSWLNRLPEVQAILAAKPIDESSLNPLEAGRLSRMHGTEEEKHQRIRQILGVWPPPPPRKACLPPQPEPN